MLPQRKRVRLEGFDYSSDRLYFITCCVKQMRHCFGEVIGGLMQLNRYGVIANNQWHWLAEQYPYDHIIRDARGYHNISAYIQDNPAKWEADKFYSR